MLTTAQMTQENVTLAQCIEVLEARRRLVNKELNAFGSPVPACDVDFNTLLAERGALSLVLSQLQPLCRGEARIPHPREDLVAH